MQSLKNTEISGKISHVEKIKNMFGNLQIGRIDPFKIESISLSLAKVLPNFYRASNATTKTAPLYVLVPKNYEISSVWPDTKELDDFRYGCSTFDGKLIVSAIAIHKGRTGIYLCLYPLNSNEIDKVEFGSLGI